MKTKAEYTIITNDEEYQTLLTLIISGMLRNKEGHIELVEEGETMESFEEFYAPEVAIFKEICHLTEKGREEWSSRMKSNRMRE